MIYIIMADMNSGGSRKGDKQAQRSAFVLFRPQHKGSDEELTYNEEALRILGFPLPPSEGGADPSLPDISAFCSKWTKSPEKGLAAEESGQSLDPETDFIDIIPSGRRRYGVRRVMLAGKPEEQTHYLFILERIGLERAHLAMLFRHHRLNKREKEIIGLLLEGKSNKEIADFLGLTLNTVKGYMKLLTRKLGVSGRSGIIAAFVEKK